MAFQNPILCGFHPDPSICRVGEDYYLAVSSFEYFPGVPLFHSKDLVNWRAIGHCLTRASQVPLDDAPSSKGIYAPTLRFHNGIFYMATTNVSGGGNFYVWTRDIEAEWSEPIWVDQRGIDPDLFFDGDGSVYFTTSSGEATTGIVQSRIDIETGKRLSEVLIIWTGTGGQYPEAPHLYKISGWYYLLIAEGGTEYGHMATIARSRRPDGPFEAFSGNPILTHRSSALPIQATGHADFVQAQDGRWWAVFLGIRPVGYPRRHHLGRETFLAQVYWDAEGWPKIGENGRVGETVDIEPLPSHPFPPSPARDDFDQPQLEAGWTFLRNPQSTDWSLVERAGHLTLHGSAVTLNDCGAPAFVGQRQQHFQCICRTAMRFEPGLDGEEAGLTVFMNERFHYEIALTRKNGRKRLIFRRCVGSLQKVEREQDWERDVVVLNLSAEPDRYTFGYAHPDRPGPPVPFGEGESSLLATEVAGGFTGVFLAMYATGAGKRSSSPAYFDWFEYLPRS
ncbi:glycoside hydrolase family 43 protein [Paenibacillus sp. IB182496]|uniref:Glycoside hydrolase family 43 protein n=1 Tax=Paenibacillus sabuli TaxID=2772509 RepID=A0A927BQZ2_9BACL|nr:glycoside hydrolase family 43 protein [Paenibacillus sabuli]MBD2844145.1 glycoside hydrolase family 43 protein [Paenibacillus sabuli]